MSELTVAYRPVWYVEPNGKRHGPFVEQADVQPLLDRLAAAEAKVRAVEALADEFQAISHEPRKWMAYPSAARMLRVALTEEA